MRPVMTGKAGQAGFSLMEIVLAVTIMASIALFVANAARNQERQANDVTAKASVSSIQMAGSQCWSIYGHEGALASRSSSDLDQIECSDNGLGNGRIVATLSEGVRATDSSSGESLVEMNPTSMKIETYHERGSNSPADPAPANGSGRTTFCQSADGSVQSLSSLQQSDPSLTECPSVKL